MIVAAILLLIATPANPDWREFEQRRRGTADSPTLYDAAHIVRRGGRVRVWIQYEGRLSGLPDPRHTELVEIDCRLNRARRLDWILVQGPLRRSGAYQSRLRPIASGSLEAALAPHLCIPG